MKPLACIKELENVEEYYDFVQQLQSFTSFPSTQKDKDGIFIVLRLTTTGKWRKMRLGIAYSKEQSGNNLTCFFLDADQRLVRATVDGDPNQRYNFLDRESMIVGCVYLLTTRLQTKRFFLTAFPFHLQLAREILQQPAYLPSFFLGILTPNNVLTNGLAVEPNIVISVEKDEIIGRRGLGSGVGIFSTVDTVFHPAVPVDTAVEGSLQIPANITTQFSIQPVPLDTYLVFQITAVGNQNNIVTVSQVNGRVVYNPAFPTVVDSF